MKRLLIAIALAAIVISSTGCHTSSGNREYVPGEGWKLTD